MGQNDDDTTVAGPNEPQAQPGEKSPHLLVLSGNSMGRSFRLSGSSCVIGRSADCDFPLDDEGISRHHAKVVLLPEGVALVKDLGSTNGTFVNERKIEAHPLDDGDRIRLGSETTLRYGLEDELEVNVRQHLFVAATRDALTGLHNKRSFKEQADRAFAFSRRHRQSLSFIVFDIDHFKNVNDTHGHAIGDEVLQGVARRVAETVRIEDTVARMGGEEFVVILPAVGCDHGILAARRIRAVIAGRPFITSKGPLEVTVSLGVAEFDPDKHHAPDDLVSDADDRLYEAKNAGRNCVRPEGSRHRRHFRDAETLVNGESVRRAAKDEIAKSKKDTE